MEGVKRHKLIWGWLRLFLGFLQVFLATATVISLLTLGEHRLTWALAASALLAVVISRLLYRSDPE